MSKAYTTTTTTVHVIELRYTCELPDINDLAPVQADPPARRVIHDNAHELAIWGACIGILTILVLMVSPEWAAGLIMIPAMHDSLDSLRH